MSEAEVFNFWTLIEEGKIIDSSLWVRYIIAGNKLTGKKVKEKKCIRRLKQNQAFLSDYWKKNDNTL